MASPLRGKPALQQGATGGGSREGRDLDLCSGEKINEQASAEMERRAGLELKLLPYLLPRRPHRVIARSSDRVLLFNNQPARPFRFIDGGGQRRQVKWRQVAVVAGP